MVLGCGGDDITEFLWVLLGRISFPYRDVDLAKAYDWNVMEDLKAKLITLAEVCLHGPGSIGGSIEFVSRAMSR